MEVSEFSPEAKKQEILREMLWKKREIFQGLEMIKKVKNIVDVKLDVRPLGKPTWRRSSKDEKFEKQTMQKLL